MSTVQFGFVNAAGCTCFPQVVDGDLSKSRVAESIALGSHQNQTLCCCFCRSRSSSSPISRLRFIRPVPVDLQRARPLLGGLPSRPREKRGGDHLTFSPAEEGRLTSKRRWASAQLQTLQKAWM